MPTAMVGVCLQNKTDGIFTEHCVVIVEGRMANGVFQVCNGGRTAETMVVGRGTSWALIFLAFS